VTGGKPIAVWWQSISGVSAVNPLVAFYDIHGSYSFILSRTPHETVKRRIFKNISNHVNGPLGRFKCHADLLTHAGLARMREISRCGSYAVSIFSFLRAGRYRQSLVKYDACAPSDSKMGSEVVGTLTHADAPHQETHSAIVPRAFITLYNRYTYEIILCGCYACGRNPHYTKNTLSVQNK
jgi:hypothetical protein